MISLIFIAIAGMLNSIMDLCIKFKESIFTKIPGMESFMNGETSWRNKYKNGDPSQGPRFFLSKGSLVFLTDMWHLSKTTMLLMLCLAIVTYTPIFVWYTDAIIYWVLFGTSFSIFYNYGFRLRTYWKRPL
jgi:uncharacterized membrane protein (Fun14 family)